jgi:hypothetical protein
MRSATTSARGRFVAAVTFGGVVLVGGGLGPASGQPSADDDTSSVGATDSFGGVLYADPETGCLDTSPPPLPEVRVWELQPDDEATRRVPLASTPGIHARPWPACQRPMDALPVDVRRHAPPDVTAP